MNAISNIFCSDYNTKAVGPNHHVIGTVPIQLIEKVVSEIPAVENWPTVKRDSHHILEQGRSLIMRDHLHRDTELRGEFKGIEELVEKVLGLGFGGMPGKIVAAYLPPGKVIKPHKDGGEYYKYHNRIHVPLLTSDGVLTTVEGSDYHMEVGKIYLFPNLRRHSVRNESDAGRIHLIVDVLDPRYSNWIYQKAWPILLTNILWLGSLYRAVRFMYAKQA